MTTVNGEWPPPTPSGADLEPYFVEETFVYPVQLATWSNPFQEATDPVGTGDFEAPEDGLYRVVYWGTRYSTGSHAAGNRYDFGWTTSHDNATPNYQTGTYMQRPAGSGLADMVDEGSVETVVRLNAGEFFGMRFRRVFGAAAMQQPRRNMTAFRLSE